MLGGGRITSAKRPLIFADAKPTRYGPSLKREFGIMYWAKQEWCQKVAV
jgi:hypothetical protein